MKPDEAGSRQTIYDSIGSAANAHPRRINASEAVDDSCASHRASGGTSPMVTLSPRIEGLLVQVAEVAKCDVSEVRREIVSMITEVDLDEASTVMLLEAILGV